METFALKRIKKYVQLLSMQCIKYIASKGIELKINNWFDIRVIIWVSMTYLFRLVVHIISMNMLDLLALLCMMFSCFVTFPFGVLGQV